MIKKIFYVLLIFLTIQIFSLPLYEYKLNDVVVFRSLGIKVEPFFEYDELNINNWEPFEPELVKIRDGKIKLILIHGISPKEIFGKMDEYKEKMIESFKEIIPKNVGIYFYLYPSLSVDLEYSAKKLVEFTENFDNLYIYAYSMGGILLRYALTNEEFSKKVKKVIFAGTPHIGSPLARLIFLDGKVLNSISDARIELIKYSLLLANFFNGYILAPNYKYLIFENKFPKIPEYVKRVNFIGRLNVFSGTLDNILNSHIPSLIGLYALKHITDNIYPKNSVFLDNDGMVPVISAKQDSEINYIFDGATHADLAMRRDIIKKAAEFFGFIGEGI